MAEIPTHWRLSPERLKGKWLEYKQLPDREGGEIKERRLCYRNWMVKLEEGKVREFGRKAILRVLSIPNLNGEVRVFSRELVVMMWREEKLIREEWEEFVMGITEGIEEVGQLEVLDGVWEMVNWLSENQLEGTGR